jgi:serine-type D-Ala-D-Ala carboxypeptidase/endopeptidase (penicillin-binding protein 4)
VDRRPPYRPSVGGRTRPGYEDWPAEAPRPIRKGRWIAAAVALTAIATGIGAAVGSRDQGGSQWQQAQPAQAVAPVLAGLSNDAKQPSESGLAAVLGPLLADPALGGHVAASVVDVDTGKPLFDRSGTGAATPASTAKLLTAGAVLEARGPAYRISTVAVAGNGPGEVVLVGAGDPTLAGGAEGTYPGAARLDDLAGQVRKALGGQPPTKVIIDGSAFSGQTLLNPGWIQQDVKEGQTSAVTALTTDGGRKDPRKTGSPTPRWEAPDKAAGEQFAKALGIPTSAVSTATAPQGAQKLGEVRSPPISRLVEMMVEQSDNVIAEYLARQVAMAKGKPASFEGGRNATREALNDIGLNTASFGLQDGSGLSNDDKVSAQMLTAVLVAAASPEHPKLRSIVSGLPVAAYTGTLTKRYISAAEGATAAGTVRAKTGTLTGVSALAGMAVDLNGRLLAFSIIADAAPVTDPAEAALDRIAAAIAQCGCA